MRENGKEKQKTKNWLEERAGNQSSPVGDGMRKAKKGWYGPRKRAWRSTVRFLSLPNGILS